MVKCKENYIGKKYGCLTVIEQVEDYIEPKSKNHKPRFLCECDCKNRIEVHLKSLKSGLTTSCGCVKNSALKPMKDNDSLVLNIVDITHKPYGKCKTYNTDEWFYFSMRDYDALKDYCWCVLKPNKNYRRLIASINGKNVTMHKLLGMDNPDHINRNPLDNRRENLDAKVTNTIQMQNRNIGSNNRSGCKGVCWHKRNSMWMAYIKINGKEVFLGYYKDKDEAIISRLNAEKQYFDKRAWQVKLMEEHGLL